MEAGILNVCLFRFLHSARILCENFNQLLPMDKKTTLSSPTFTSHNRITLQHMPSGPSERTVAMLRALARNVRWDTRLPEGLQQLFLS